MGRDDELNINCVYLQAMMGFKRSIGIIEYVLVCLAFVFMSKAGISMSYDSEEITGEIRNHESNLIRNEISAISVPETQCRIPRQSNFSISLRSFSLSGRNSTNIHSRTGFAMMKAGKSMNESTTNLFLTEILNFPSGLNESNHHLISLRKLLI